MSENKNISKPWGGRFTEPTDVFVEAFTASVQFDQRMYKQDIKGSIAHAAMLFKVGVLTKEECDAIAAGLHEIENEIEAGQFGWSVGLEDIHMNIEARLTQKIGDAGKKLHTGRSRNDQVATDMRLYLRDEIDEILIQLRRLQTALIDLAEREVDTILPGYTHLQVAQPISFGHHMLAWFENLQRDASRLSDCRKRLNVLPLGAAALAGTTYPIDRHYTANLLGFDSVAENSLDAVSDRDFIVEFCFISAQSMTHLSRFSEELVLWVSQQFDFIEMGDSFCTGSSIMPQKKNPDVPELIRGKTGRTNGNLIALLTLMKSQPLAYNKDNQEDKEPLFDSIDTLKASFRVFADMMKTVTVKRDNMLQATLKGYSTATDLADYLVKKGVPFRDAHEVVGKAVRYGIEQGKDLAEMSLDELQNFSTVIEGNIFEVLTPEGSCASRDHFGGTAPSQVRQAIQRARARIQD